MSFYEFLYSPNVLINQNYKQYKKEFSVKKDTLENKEPIKELLGSKSLKK